VLLLVVSYIWFCSNHLKFWLAGKIISERTYNVPSGMLNPTVLYHIIPTLLCEVQCSVCCRNNLSIYLTCVLWNSHEEPCMIYRVAPVVTSLRDLQWLFKSSIVENTAYVTQDCYFNCHVQIGLFRVINLCTYFEKHCDTETWFSMDS